MSSSPLANKRYEKFALFVAAGLSPNEAHPLAGYEVDATGSNAAKLMRRPEIKARIADIRGESVEKVEPDTGKDAVRKQMSLLAFDPATPAPVRATLLKHLDDAAMSEKSSEYWPESAEDFDVSKLSDRQRRLCQMYDLRPAQKRPADIISEKLAAIRAKSENYDKLSESSSPSEPVSEHRSQPSLVWEERTSRMTLTSNVSAHGAR